MLIKILRMDALTESSSTFVSLTLGEHYIGSHEQSLNNIYKSSKPQNPILFILSPGLLKCSTFDYWFWHLFMDRM